MSGERVKRLVGDPSGGGLPGTPLPDALGKMLELLLDNQTASFEELNKVVSGALEYKKAMIFKAFHSWKAFTRDLIDQLQEEGFLTAVGTDDFYTVTDKVAVGKSLLVVDAGDPARDVRVTVHSASQREMLGKISEVRSEAVQQGVLNQEVELHLSEIANVVDRKRQRRGAHAGSLTRPEDEPGYVRMCTECGKDYPVAEEFFTIYKSRIEYYRNRKCSDCRRRLENEARVAKQQATNTKLKIRRFVDRDPAPSVQEVMDHLGVQDSFLVRDYWDELADLGVVQRRKP